MNQKQLITLVKAKAKERGNDMSSEEIEGLLHALSLVVVTEMSIEGGEIPLPGIGKLKAATRAPRTGRNPQTGKAIEIAAKNTVTFKPSSALLAAIA